jgi:hypothetical protein
MIGRRALRRRPHPPPGFENFKRRAVDRHHFGAASGRNSGEVADALRRANGSVKLAVLLLNGCDPGEASSVLERAGRRLRSALQYISRRTGAARTGAEGGAVDAPPIVEEHPTAVIHGGGDDDGR